MKKVKVLLFIYVDEYIKSPDSWCTPTIGAMKSSNVVDAMQECSNSPSCYMFYQWGWNGTFFTSCKNTAKIMMSPGGSVLYQPKGSKIMIANFIIL